MIEIVVDVLVILDVKLDQGQVQDLIKITMYQVEHITKRMMGYEM